MNVKKEVEKRLSNYKTERADLEERVESILGAGHVDVVEIREESLPGDPSGQKAAKIADDKKIKKLRRRCRQVDRLLSALTKRQRDLVELRYFEGRPWSMVAGYLDLSVRQSQRIRDDIVDKASEIWHLDEEAA